MYNFDFEKLLKWLIPFELRKPKTWALFRSLLSHLEDIYNEFLIKVQSTEDRIRITGQVRILRHELNNRFDEIQRRIEILDVDVDSVLFIFVEAENQPVYLPQYISGASYDFLVRVPVEYQNQEPFIKDFLNTYKEAGKRYQIEYF